MSESSGRHTAALTLSVFALLSVAMYAGLVYALWTINVHNAVLQSNTAVLKSQATVLQTQTADLEKQNAVLKNQAGNLEKQNADFEERLQIIEARELLQGSSEPVTVMNTLKRMAKREADSSRQSATDLLTDALCKLIEKKLYTSYTGVPC